MLLWLDYVCQFPDDGVERLLIAGGGRWAHDLPPVLLPPVLDGLQALGIGGWSGFSCCVHISCICCRPKRKLLCKRTLRLQ